MPENPTGHGSFPDRDPRQTLGRAGERWAAQYLQCRGARVLATNWRARLSEHGVKGELDLVVLIGDTLVGVEVKTRSGTGFGHPLDSITPVKLRRLHRLLAAWAREQGEQTRPRRVDAVAVLVTRPAGGAGHSAATVRLHHRPGLIE
ncbi:YraN family protein [Kocuria sp. JC486]|uniref:UPF0102 protein EDL96_12030 n=1 Tax=Kocuria soli TaxID=2485125 RepID=A0A3N4A121_9MICC|nr:YraN family protein [Kocuria soli]NHU85759.1 YraN family protein [Kocuria sp. JC486]ROZ61837.1 YraN family protein [Kocuria soli]